MSLLGRTKIVLSFLNWQARLFIVTDFIGLFSLLVSVFLIGEGKPSLFFECLCLLSSLLFTSIIVAFAIFDKEQDPLEYIQKTGCCPKCIFGKVYERAGGDLICENYILGSIYRLQGRGNCSFHSGPDGRMRLVY